MNELRRCSYIISCILLLFFSGCTSAAEQQEFYLKDLNLVDTLNYVPFYVSDVFVDKYPPSNIFDSDFRTCWVMGSETNKKIPSIYLKIPELDKAVLNIFSGYGKSESLYFMNARPKTIHLSLLIGINPEGYVSEHAALYKTVEFPRKKVVQLADTFAVRSLPLEFDKNEIDRFKKSVYHLYDSTAPIPAADSCMILKIDIPESYPGTRYTDICISEIFFNDRLISKPVPDMGKIDSVYLNPDENALMINNFNINSEIVYQDTSSVLQIIDESKDKKWAVLISMPAEIEGRAETSYHLINLYDRKDPILDLEKITGNYMTGNEIYFQQGEDGTTFLMYLGDDYDYHKIELK